MQVLVCNFLKHTDLTLANTDVDCSCRGSPEVRQTKDTHQQLTSRVTGTACTACSCETNARPDTLLTMPNTLLNRLPNTHVAMIGPMLSGLRERFPLWMIDLFLADFDGLLSGGSRESEAGAVSRIDTEAYFCCCSNRPNRTHKKCNFRCKNKPLSPLRSFNGPPSSACACSSALRELLCLLNLAEHRCMFEAIGKV
jgi:hypothetical protein